MARKLNLRNVVQERFGTDLRTYLTTSYFEKGMDQYKIAHELNCSAAAICLWFSKLGIKTHPNGTFQKGRKLSPEHVEIISRTHKGKAVSKETRKKLSESRKGVSYIGRSKYFTGKKRRSDGYIQIYRPDHPYSNSDGYVMEHRLVMESIIGRYLRPEEEVHHKNEIKHDNRPENLHLFASKKEHAAYHMRKRHRERKRREERA